MANALLNGIRILDLSRLLPGPYCTMLLADLGADVIKVEPPGVGDYARQIPEQHGGDALFAAVNRNKRSLALDFRRPHGKDLLFRLAGRCHVMLETFRPGAAHRWGIGPDAMRAAHPGLIYCSLSGYGQQGPYADRAGHDLNYVALAGVLGLNGAAGGPPLPLGVQVADLAGGMLAAIAILAAVAGSRITGEGAYLDIAMLDASVSWLAPLAGILAAAGAAGFAGTRPSARGTAPLSGGLPSYHVYECAGGAYLAVAALEAHLWGALCARLERPDLGPRRLDPSAVGELAALFRTRTRTEWLERFQGADVCVEPVNDLADVMADPHLRRRGVIVGGEPPASPARIASPFGVMGRSPGNPAPRLGEHTRPILLEAGLTEDEIEALAAEKVISLPDPAL